VMRNLKIDRSVTLLLSLVVLALALCGWVSCAANTPPPVPPGIGGAPTAGGATSTGGTSTGGAPGATGGASVAGAAAVAWPECAPDGTRLAPAKRHPLGRKRSAITRRIKASSYVDLNLPDVFWEPAIPAPPNERFVEPLDQGDIGKCTCEGAMGLLITQPNVWRGTHVVTALDLITDDLYRWATRHDPFTTPKPGYWEPIDTGSNGESALNAAVALGYLEPGAFVEIGSFEELQTALQKGPCIVGVDWYDGFFSPDRCGAVKKTGAIAGGHEILIVGHRRATKQTLGRNSWGRPYGRDGYFWFTDGTLAELLAAGGDAHCLSHPVVSPANDNAVTYREAG